MVSRQLVYGHVVYDTSSTDISSTDISSTMTLLAEIEVGCITVLHPGIQQQTKCLQTKCLQTKCRRRNVRRRIVVEPCLSLSSHFYADDSKLYTWGPPSTVAQQRHLMEQILPCYFMALCIQSQGVVPKQQIRDLEFGKSKVRIPLQPLGKELGQILHSQFPVALRRVT